MKFNFHFGKKKASLKTIVILTLLIASLAGVFKIEESKIWDIVYETILYFDPDNSLIPELQKDPGIIERKSERTVDKAIREVKPEYDRIIEEDNKQYQPRYIEENDTEFFGGPMRLCAPWINDCNSKE